MNVQKLHDIVPKRVESLISGKIVINLVNAMNLWLTDLLAEDFNACNYHNFHYIISYDILSYEGSD